MATLVIKNLPEGLHARLKLRAEQHRRSLTKEALELIESGLAAGTGRTGPLPEPVELRSGHAPNIKNIEAAIREIPMSAMPVADPTAALRSALVLQPDGSYVNELGIDDPAFFAALEEIRDSSRREQPRNPFDDRL
jgi:plasmid stability protein